MPANSYPAMFSLFIDASRLTGISPLPLEMVEEESFVGVVVVAKEPHDSVAYFWGVCGNDLSLQQSLAVVAS